MAKREVLRKELSALSPDELRFLVTRQLRCERAGLLRHAVVAEVWVQAVFLAVVRPWPSPRTCLAKPLSCPSSRPLSSPPSLPSPAHPRLPRPCIQVGV